MLFFNCCSFVKNSVMLFILVGITIRPIDAPQLKSALSILDVQECCPCPNGIGLAEFFLLKARELFKFQIINNNGPHSFMPLIKIN